jgi:3-hydroxybutyryl-CoA dehydrogenase
MSQIIVVIGAGVMGKGIAKSFAKNGNRVYMISRRPESITDMPAEINVVKDLPNERPDLVIETIPEDTQLKLECYRQVEEKYPGGVPLASNTSALDLEKLGANLKHPELFHGIHYFMPADLMKFVEVAATSRTTPAIMQAAADALKRVGKMPIILNKAVPGLLINRLQHAILHEAYQMIDQGVVTPADVDLVARELLGPRMCITGLIEQKDIGGLEIHANAQKALVPVLGLSREPSRCLQDLYEAGHLGIRTGKGFYEWPDGKGDARKKQAASELKGLLEFLDKNVTKPA